MKKETETMSTISEGQKAPTKTAMEISKIVLLPILVKCVVFIANFSADFAVAVQHFREMQFLWGYCTLGLMYSPAVVYFVLTVSRPDWWMIDDDKTTKGVIRWFFRQLLQLIAFPLFALYRLAAQIVLTVDAILLVGEEREKTLNIIAAPAAIELYFFLQAWFQAAPQAVFQTHLLLREQTFSRTFQSEMVHVFSVIVSIIVIAKVTAAFYRYESQRLTGKKLPWAMWYQKYKIQEKQNLEEQQPLRTTANTSSAENVQLIENQQVPGKELGKRIFLQRQDSETPPLPPKNAQVIAPPTPLRRITTLKPLPVPDMPAPPRPDSMATEPENPEPSEVEIRAPERYENEPPKSQSLIKLPQRISTQTLNHQQDQISVPSAFMWWFYFVFARIMSIMIFFRFFPIELVSVLGIHYVVMIAYLFYRSKYLDLASFFLNLWLGLVYIFCIIEYRIKFDHAEKWLVTYYAFVMIQNVGMSLMWYLRDDWRHASTFLIMFSFQQIFYAIFASMVVCIVSLVVHYVFLKPKRRKIYIT